MKATELSAEYVEARIKVRRIEKEVARLAAKGDHKRKNKIISTQLRKATIARNMAESRLVAELDRIAEGQV